MRSIEILQLLPADCLQGIFLIHALLRLEDGKAFAPGADLEEVLMFTILGSFGHRDDHIARTSIMLTLDLHSASDTTR